MRFRGNGRGGLFTALLISAAALLAPPGNLWAQGESERPLKLCNLKYALCMAASCVPVPEVGDRGLPKKPQRAICTCETIPQGDSIGFQDCDQREPRTIDGIEHLVSTYGWADVPSQPLMTCPSGTPRTNCFSMPCIVDPDDPTRSICNCIVTQDVSEPMMTRGGSCDAAECADLYQGGTPAQVKLLNDRLSELSGKSIPDPNVCKPMK